MAKSFSASDIVRAGTKFVIPEKLTMREAKTWIERMIEEEEVKIGITETVDSFPLDGAVALSRVLSEKYGFAKTNRGSGMISLETSFGVTEQIPWGSFSVPGIDGTNISCGVKAHEGRFVFTIETYGPGKYKSEIHDIAESVRRYVANSSIYRGKATRISLPDPNDRDFSPENGPKFIDVSHGMNSPLIFNDGVQAALEDNIYGPIQYTEKVRSRGIPLKRTVLLGGPYGTGKTLTGTVIAGLAEKHGWTMFYLEDPKDIPRAVSLARSYQPCVIFAEDVDKVLSERDSDMEEAFDGFSSKGGEIMMILTTNNSHKIHPVYRRSGRIDKTVVVTPPDSKTSVRLVRAYAKDQLSESENLSAVGKELAGMIPASIREVVERAKLSAVVRAASQGGEDSIKSSDLLRASQAMRMELESQKEFVEDNRTGIEKLGSVVGSHIERSIRHIVSESNYSPSFKGAVKALNDSENIAVIESES